MSRGLNRCEFIGNLGADPEMKYTQNGTAVCTFSLACNEAWKDRDGNKQERVEWVKVVTWRQLAEICEKYLEKGRQVYIAGKMQTRQWEDRDGATRYTTEIVASEMLMLSGDSRERDPNVDAPHPDPGSQERHEVDDDIPF